MNTIPMKVLQEALAALDVAGKALLDTGAPYPTYRQVMCAEVVLRACLERMPSVEVTQ